MRHRGRGDETGRSVLLTPGALSAFLVFCVVSLLGACAGLPDEAALTPVQATVPGAQLVTIYAATTRERKGPQSVLYTSEPAAQLNFARYTVSVPPGHKPTEIEWPDGKADPKRSFATVKEERLTEAEFYQQITARNGKGELSPGRDDVGVFVHGYNTSFAESLFRLAQITVDSDPNDVPVLFAWPSEAAVTGYVADKDAVTYSRDYLAGVLTHLARDREVGDITVFGHSMGGWLVMEVLRQLRLSGHGDVISGIEEVILASPDIDIDVFRTQIAVIGRNHPPMTILVSKQDRALAISRRVGGGRPRLGGVDVDDPEIQQLAVQYNLRIIDISQLPKTDFLGHDQFVTLAARLGSTGRRGFGQLGEAGAFVFDAVGNTVASPFRIASDVLSQ
ncbi:alpha/beta fold hydrolase [Afifella sp. H1R]|uniref:alpha/beta hydrolase n=1 Tax=Afifella sp. H1R TaxID=2908841 RepID=UPI001F22BA69|nr:alpha/beta fold hydrolase [Afifella sp. H1R]MCF1502966.1 alpha/beta fold hydrolase [Afifella sp. H1R]